jgi:hypothetical protein
MAVTTKFGVPVSGETGATLMPKLQYRFRVTFEGIGNGRKATQITRQVVSVTRPALDHEDITIDAYNSKIRMAGKHTWQDVTLVVRDDVNGEVAKFLGEQLNKQVDHNDQSSALAGESYKFTMKVELLDGSNEDNGNALESWKLVGCFIPSIQYGDLNYATSDVVQITATIRYDNASHAVGGLTDALSSVDASRTGSSTTR